MSSKLNPQSRLDWITNVKGLVIAGVVLAHSPLTAFKVHFSFYALPVFFLIAGMFFKEGLSLGQFAKERFERLMLPYFLYALVGFFCWACFEWVNGHWSGDLWTPFVGTLLGWGKPPWLAHNIPLWFIPCFYLALLYFQGLKQLSGSKLPWVIGGLAIFGFYLPRLLPFWLPWSADVAVLACVFIGLGYLFKNVLKREQTLPWWVLGLLFAFNTMAYLSNGPTDLNYRSYGHIGWYYPGVLCGVLLVFELAKRIPPNRILTALGNQSLLILGLHSLGINLMYQFYYAVFQVHSLDGFHGLMELFPAWSKWQVLLLYLGVVSTFLIAGLLVPFLLLYLYNAMRAGVAGRRLVTGLPLSDK